MNAKGWLPYPMCWNLPDSEFSNCLYTDGANDQYVFLPPATLAMNQRVLAVRTDQSLKGDWVY